RRRRPSRSSTTSCGSFARPAAYRCSATRSTTSCGGGQRERARPPGERRVRGVRGGACAGRDLGGPAAGAAVPEPRPGGGDVPARAGVGEERLAGGRRRAGGA